MKKIIFIFALVAFTLTSCEKNNQEVGIINDTELFEQNDYNIELKEFSNSVINALKSNKEFRQLIKKEALKQFDGDYDVLLSRIIDTKLSQSENNNGVSKISTNITVKNLLENSYYRNTNAILKIKSENNPFEELLQKYPLLQISIPENAEKWDPTSDIPVITFIPKEFEDGITKFVTGYTHDGQLITIDAVNPPDFPVIVIGQNERIDENGNVIQYAKSLVSTKTN